MNSIRLNERIHKVGFETQALAGHLGKLCHKQENWEYLPVSVAEAKTVKENLYEGMFLVDSTEFANDPEATTEAIMAILERAGATVVAHRPWQDGKLAYEIAGRRKGLHYLVCFRMPGAGMEVITRQSHLSDTILRQMVIRHTPELFEAMVNSLTGADAEQPTEEAAGDDE